MVVAHGELASQKLLHEICSRASASSDDLGVWMDLKHIGGVLMRDHATGMMYALCAVETNTDQTVDQLVEQAYSFPDIVYVLRLLNGRSQLSGEEAIADLNTAQLLTTIASGAYERPYCGNGICPDILSTLGSIQVISEPIVGQ